MCSQAGMVEILAVHRNRRVYLPMIFTRAWLGWCRKAGYHIHGSQAANWRMPFGFSPDLNERGDSVHFNSAQLLAGVLVMSVHNWIAGGGWGAGQHSA